MKTLQIYKKKNECNLYKEKKVTYFYAHMPKAHIQNMPKPLGMILVCKENVFTHTHSPLFKIRYFFFLLPFLV